MSPGADEPEDNFRGLSEWLHRYANSNVPRVDFLCKITRRLLDFSGCDAIELRVKKDNKCFLCEATHHATQPLTYEIIYCGNKEEDVLFFSDQDNNGLNKLYRINMPIYVADETIGLLQLKSRQEDYFKPEEIKLYENVAQTLGLALVNQSAHAALRERVKELTCLYNLAQLAENPDITLEEILQSTVDLLPPAWQYPEITAGRIILDAQSYMTANFKEVTRELSSDIVVRDERRGGIDVVYTEEKPELDEGPFLKEERSLIDAVARQISFIIERRQAEDERLRLQDQLRHADRLATIGQLAAGVSHELNEPLGNILAFAQLAQKESGLPDQTAQDLEKIVTTSLHAREIVKKLMLFARQTPPQKKPVNLNTIVEEGLYFLESRCSKSGVSIIRHLSDELPEITADPSQLNQVLVNLVVNSIQAMPAGGTLTITTCACNNQVAFRIEDTGIGMGEDVLKQIFIPFFTTKDINEGTGLGLPVVHGIINSHGGAINVESVPGKGSRFEIQLPIAKTEKNRKNHSNDKDE
jgi:signal transduction histidine kinase